MRLPTALSQPGQSGRILSHDLFTHAAILKQDRLVPSAHIVADLDEMKYLF